VTAWATPVDVKAVTGVTVVEDAIGPAQILIELFANTTEEATDRHGLISSRNMRLLKWAVCYQVAWMGAHPDVYTNVDVEHISQDRVAATMGHENAGILAPLALRCLRRLSWWNRPLRVRPPRPAVEDMQYNRGDRDSVGYDDEAPDWEPT
jgi:hypothetical protein